MAKKNNVKTLLIVFIVLIGILALLQIRTRKTESSLKRDLIKVDTAKVTSIILYPQAEKGAALEITRKGDKWRIKKGKKEAPVEAGSVRNMLNEIIHIRPKRLAAVSDTAWDDYSVTDSTATRLVVQEGHKKTLDLYIGKFTVDKNAQMYGGYQGRVMGSSYIRPGNQKEVYEVDGFLALSFNQNFDAWRDHLFIRTTRSNLRKFTFTYPADSGFVVQYADSLWNVEGAPADSAGMANYLADWTFRRYADFADNYDPPANPDFQITAEGNNMDPVVIKAYRDPRYHFVMNSSMNPETWFADKDSSIYKMFFVPKAKFLNKSGR
ncbi:MAG: DUF4340 domain-containing protein [Chlorobi bacterium]|nr:DUF4340 domain-containing protein [Chlorobiota bacterium]